MTVGFQCGCREKRAVRRYETMRRDRREGGSRHSRGPAGVAPDRANRARLGDGGPKASPAHARAPEISDRDHVFGRSRLRNRSPGEVGGTRRPANEAVTTSEPQIRTALQPNLADGHRVLLVLYPVNDHGCEHQDISGAFSEIQSSATSPMAAHFPSGMCAAERQTSLN